MDGCEQQGPQPGPDAEENFEGPEWDRLERETSALSLEWPDGWPE